MFLIDFLNAFLKNTFSYLKNYTNFLIWTLKKTVFDFTCYNKKNGHYFHENIYQEKFI